MGRYDLASVPRKAIFVLFALAQCPEKGATYKGLKIAMGLASRSSLRQAVLAAEEAGLVRVITTGPGRGAPSIMQLTRQARAILKGLGLLDECTPLEAQGRR